MITLMAMSLRKDSLNKKLIRATKPLISEACQILEFNDFSPPVYDGDLEAKSGVPEVVQSFAKIIQQSKALILSTPEYNGGIMGVFKNWIDWLSRVQPSPFSYKPILLMGASPGALGAVRGLWHSRVPLEALKCFVYPEMFGLSFADKAFAEQGELQDPKTSDRLKKLITEFLAHA